MLLCIPVTSTKQIHLNLRASSTNSASYNNQDRFFELFLSGAAMADDPISLYK